MSSGLITAYFANESGMFNLKTSRLATAALLWDQGLYWLYELGKTA